MAGKNILFICSANVNRSPSAQFWFSYRKPENNYDSAGSSSVACRIHHGKFVTRKQLEQADRIICMEERNRKDINAKFPGYNNKMEVAGIKDEFVFLQLDLIFEMMDKINI